MLHQHFPLKPVPPENRGEFPCKTWRSLHLSSTTLPTTLSFYAWETGFSKSIAAPWCHMGGLRSLERIPQTIPWVVFLEPKPDHRSCLLLSDLLGCHPWSFVVTLVLHLHDSAQILFGTWFHCGYLQEEHQKHGDEPCELGLCVLMLGEVFLCSPLSIGPVLC